jgi:hypothetical protein
MNVYNWTQEPEGFKETRTVSTYYFNPDKPRFSFTIGVPIGRNSVSADWWFSFESMKKPNGCLLATTTTQSIDRAREQLASLCTTDWLFFLDSDVFVPKMGLIDLLNTAIKNKLDIVSGLYFNRSPPHPPVAYIRKSEFKYDPLTHLPSEGLMEVDGVGGGCLLIRTKVFKELERPWFDYDKLSEDLYFCSIAKKAGFKIWLYSKLICGHQTEMILTDANFMRKEKK